MKAQWYRGISKSHDPAAYEERADLVKSARPTLEILKKIVEERLDVLRKQQQAKEHYELASWPYLQADILGGMRELESILELLTLEKTQ